MLAGVSRSDGGSSREKDKRGDAEAELQVVPHDSFVTADFMPDRI